MVKKFFDFILKMVGNLAIGGIAFLGGAFGIICLETWAEIKAPGSISGAFKNINHSSSSEEE